MMEETETTIPILYIPTMNLIIYFNQWEKLYEYSVESEPEYIPPYGYNDIVTELKLRGEWR